MSRRHTAEKRIVLPDAKFGDKVVAKFINNVMEHGKKAVAEKIVYSAFDIIAAKAKQDALKVFAEAIENEFIDANIRILAEYGVPSSAIRKILDRYGRHLRNLTEDQVVAAIIRNRTLINQCLTQYEIEALARCL